MDIIAGTKQRPLRWAAGMLLAALACTGVARAGDDEQVLSIPIGGTEAEPFANGSATYRVRPGETKLEVEVEDLRNTTAVEVFVDGVSIGSAAVVLGNAEVEVESERDVVPVLTLDSQVIVTNATTGDTIAASGNVIVDDDDGEGNDDNGGDDNGGDDNGSDDDGEDDGGHGGGGEEVVTTLGIGGTDLEPFANGSARYRVRPGQTSLEIEVEDLRSVASVEFFLDGQSLGTAPVALGRANIELESERDVVPVLTELSVVVVTNADTGETIAASGNVIVDDDGREGNDDNGGDDNGEDDDDDRGEIEFEFVLTGTANDPGAYGKAELKNDNELRRIEVEVQRVTAAQRVSVLVDGINVGASRVREGEAKVERDERLEYTIPVVSAASRVDVINSETGAILLSNKDVVISPEGETEGSPEGAVEGEGEGATEGEPQPVDGIVLKQKLGPNGFYVPGETTVIEARMEYTGTVPVLALSIEQTLPEGWEFVRTVDNMGAFLNPRAGDTGTLTWAWIAVPKMPAVLRYEVFVPATATGVQTVGGNVLYRRMGGAEYAAATLDIPAGEGFSKAFCHATDSNQSWTVELTEVLRMIQLYNVGAYHCDEGSEDGYAPGEGDDSCLPHDADHLRTDWSVDISELLRTIQFYNAEDGAYHVEFETEDGFSPGSFSLED